jgi:hypothetical protein
MSTGAFVSIKRTGVASVAMLMVLCSVAPLAGATANKDKTLATRSLLRAADLGPGWKSTPAGPSTPNPCTAYLDAKKTASVDSPVFSLPTATSLQSNTTYYTTDTAAKQDVHIFQNPTSRACVKKNLQSGLNKQFTSQLGSGTRVILTFTSRTPKAGGDVVGLRIIVKVVPPGKAPVYVFLDVLASRHDRRIVSLTATSVTTPFDSTTEDGLLRTLERRLA